ncbi:MAG TPA: hypothetical protein VGB19_11495 [Actinomycetota bacterium]
MKVRRNLPWILLAVTTAAAVAFAVLWLGAARARDRADAENRRRAEVVSVGTEFLSVLTNFKADTIDADVERIRSYAVGDFADQVDQFFGPDTVAALKRAQAESVGRVREVFVQSLDASSASVFGVVDEVITNARSAPRSETVRIDVELLDTTGGWKVSSVEILQSPGGGPLG